LVILAIDAELAGHADKLDMKLQSLCGNGFFFVCCAHTCQALPLWSKSTKNLQKKMGYISLPSNLNGMIIGITSYYCVILKIMTLLDAKKTSKNKVFLFSLKNKQNLVSF